VSRGQRGGSPTVVNLSFLDRKKTIMVTELAASYEVVSIMLEQGLSKV
jgi:hypothetical protein